MKPVKSIAFAGLMAALHVGATFLAKYAPGFQLIILFIIPFFSAMYAIKAEAKYCLIYFVATIIACMFVSWTDTLLYVLPSLVAGLLYGFLVKAKQGGTAIVYTLTIAEFGLICLAALIGKKALGNEYIEVLKQYFPIGRNNQHLGFGLVIAYCFAQSFLIHIITKYELKKVKIEVNKSEYPPLWIFALHIISLICCFLPYKDEVYVFFSAMAAVVFGLPVALYGYQSTEKIWIILAAQAVVFLAGTLPLLKLFEDEGYKAIAAYIILFVPPLVMAFINLFKQESIELKK